MSRKKPPVEKKRGNGFDSELMMLTSMSEWRHQHPHASLREIEEAMDQRLNQLRAGMLEELVKMSPQADWSATPKDEHPVCERCGKRLVSRGKQRCQWQTSGGHSSLQVTTEYMEDQLRKKRAYGEKLEQEYGL